MTEYMKMKRADFKELPRLNYLDCFGEVFDSLIIIPERRKHDSGFMCMSVAGCRGANAVCIMGGGSDVIHFDGIGGYGKPKLKIGYGLPDEIPIKSWHIDCIPCGYLRIFSNKGKISIGNVLSDFEIFCEVEK